MIAIVPAEARARSNFAHCSYSGSLSSAPHSNVLPNTAFAAVYPTIHGRYSSSLDQQDVRTEGRMLLLVSNSTEGSGIPNLNFDVLCWCGVPAFCSRDLQESLRNGGVRSARRAVHSKTRAKSAIYRDGTG